jgi:hypothetical protein
VLNPRPGFEILTLKTGLETGAAILTLAGVFVGVYGTYKMTKYYHPYSWLEFAKSIRTAMWRDLTGQSESADRQNRVASRLAGSEDKAISLRGVEWVFVGFVIQTLGAILALIDVLCSA